jgi:hypothetical protein
MRYTEQGQHLRNIFRGESLPDWLLCAELVWGTLPFSRIYVLHTYSGDVVGTRHPLLIPPSVEGARPWHSVCRYGLHAKVAEHLTRQTTSHDAGQSFAFAFAFPHCSCASAWWGVVCTMMWRVGAAPTLCSCRFASECCTPSRVCTSLRDTGAPSGTKKGPGSHVTLPTRTWPAHSPTLDRYRYFTSCIRTHLVCACPQIYQKE